jgi:hypothetical protein
MASLKDLAKMRCAVSTHATVKRLPFVKAVNTVTVLAGERVVAVCGSGAIGYSVIKGDLNSIH